jgi:hypothetical protein
LNGDPLATVSSDGLSLVDVNVSGDCVGPELAILRISGSAHDEERPKKYLIWEGERHLADGDEIRVTFLESEANSRPGKTIEELYPAETISSGETPPPESLEETIRELGQRPRLHERLTFLLTPPDGTNINGATRPDEHGFGFSVGWVWLHPERARVSLHTYTLKSLIDRSDMRDHARMHIEYGQSVTFRVDA